VVMQVSLKLINPLPPHCADKNIKILHYQSLPPSVIAILILFSREEGLTYTSNFTQWFLTIFVWRKLLKTPQKQNLNKHLYELFEIDD